MLYNSEKGAETDQQDDTAAGFFSRLPEAPLDTLRLFNRGDFFSAYDDDAQYIARHLFRTQTVIKKVLRGKLDAVNIPVVQTQGFMREALTMRQLRLEIYETPAGARSKWELAKTASPGNFGDLEDILFANSDIMVAPVIISIVLETREGNPFVGVCFTEGSAQWIGLSEFADTPQFTNLEAFAIQMGVKEALVPEVQSDEYQNVIAMLSRCSIVTTTLPRRDFKDAKADLRELLKKKQDGLAVSPPDPKEFDMTCAMQSCGALIYYLGLATRPENHGVFELRQHDLSLYMRLDSSAVQALHLAPDPKGAMVGSKRSSLFGLLNHCITAQGTRLLLQWIKQPLVNVHQILHRQEYVETLYENDAVKQAFVEQLKYMPDFQRLAKRFRRGVATLEHVIRIYQAVDHLPVMLSLLEQLESDLFKERFIEPMSNFYSHLSKYQEMVTATIDMDQLEYHNYVIKADFDDTLLEIKQKMDELRSQLHQEHCRVADDLGMSTDQKVLHFEMNQVYGQCFRLTRKEAHAIKSKPQYIELGNKGNGVHFTTKKLKSLNESFTSLNSQYAKRQQSLAKEVIEIASSYSPVLDKVNQVVASLDVLCSFATAAKVAPIPYVKPTILSDGSSQTLDLKRSRHPCLEVQEGVNFIPNDIQMRRDTDEFYLITGPNMGGKSTYIRQAGVIALMAQIGCFVPCDEATVSVFDSILCRVGAGDNQLKGVSTFMAEMLETAAILRSATDKSLVIVDELGRGTSTYDGFGLAWAISEHLASHVRAFCLFATHFHELTALSNQIPWVKNYHVRALASDDTDISLLYQVEPGATDQSFGIHVARMARFPQPVINLAKRKASELESFDNSSLYDPSVTPDDTASGTSLIKDMLSTWASERKKRKVGSPQDDAALLREVYGNYETRLSANPWVQKFLAKTY